MKHFQIAILLFCSLFFSIAAAAQDSAKTLSVADFMQIVRQFHPVALQADNTIEQAKAAVLSARGLFDPVLEFTAAEKMFDGKQYYRYTQPQITIPAWYGVALYAGAENVSGTRLNPEETTGRTSYAGIKVSLLQGLVLDKRRAVLQQAKILAQQSTAEKRAVLNNLLRDAVNAYWLWTQKVLFKNTIDGLVAVNEKRLQLVKTSVRLGERPAIDTVEALAQLQTFLALQQEQNAAVQNAAFDLSLFLWMEVGEPYQLPNDVLPATSKLSPTILETPAVDSLLQYALAEHPELQQYVFKQNHLQIEQRLKFQELLPALDVKYNQLGRGYDVLKTATAPVLSNNYRYGISFSLPLRLSEGRGAYRAAKLKIKNIELEQAQKRAAIQNKVKTYATNLQALQAQIKIQQAAVKNYTALQRAEEQRFFAGESSLFFINSRENKVLEGNQKLIELQTKYQQSLTDLRWAAGILYKRYD